MKKLIVCIALVLSLSTGALALETPTDTTVQNLNGNQQLIKTYTIPTHQSSVSLIEEPFELDGFRYVFSDIAKEENHIEKTKVHREVVTVETETNDLSVILCSLESVIEYDDGVFRGTLALVHNGIVTEAAGYTTGSYTVTETKIIGALDRNDMSYVPATTTKDGMTLELTDVEWQITGTDIIGEALMPSSYQAVATYSTEVSYQTPVGYITTAEYVGEITGEEVTSATYTVTYLGTAISPEPIEIEEDTDSTDDENATVSAWIADKWPFLLAGGGLVVAAVFEALSLRSYRAAKRLDEGDEIEDIDEEVSHK